MPSGQADCWSVRLPTQYRSACLGKPDPVYPSSVVVHRAFCRADTWRQSIRWQGEANRYLGVGGWLLVMAVPPVCAVGGMASFRPTTEQGSVDNSPREEALAEAKHESPTDPGCVRLANNDMLVKGEDHFRASAAGPLRLVGTPFNFARTCHVFMPNVDCRPSPCFSPQSGLTKLSPAVRLSPRHPKNRSEKSRCAGGWKDPLRVDGRISPQGFIQQER